MFFFSTNLAAERPAEEASVADHEVVEEKSAQVELPTITEEGKAHEQFLAPFPAPPTSVVAPEEPPAAFPVVSTTPEFITEYLAKFQWPNSSSYQPIHHGAWEADHDIFTAKVTPMLATKVLKDFNKVSFCCSFFWGSF